VVNSWLVSCGLRRSARAHSPELANECESSVQLRSYGKELDRNTRSIRSTALKEEWRRSAGGDARNLARDSPLDHSKKAGRMRAERPIDQRPAKRIKKPASAVGCTGIRSDPFHMKNASRLATPSSARWMCSRSRSGDRAENGQKSTSARSSGCLQGTPPKAAKEAMLAKIIRRLARLTTP
jgi:hypothetical protein